MYGSDGAAAYAITGWIWGQESCATVFPAPQTPCGRAGGFAVEQVHFSMNFRTTDLPVTFNAAVAFHEAAAAATPGCLVPGPEVCASPTYQLTITDAGLYGIALPMGPCACAFFEYGCAVSITPSGAPSRRPSGRTP